MFSRFRSWGLPSAIVVLGVALARLEARPDEEPAPRSPIAQARRQEELREAVARLRLLQEAMARQNAAWYERRAELERRQRWWRRLFERERAQLAELRARREERERELSRLDGESAPLTARSLALRALFAEALSGYRLDELPDDRLARQQRLRDVHRLLAVTGEAAASPFDVEAAVGEGFRFLDAELARGRRVERVTLEPSGPAVERAPAARGYRLGSLAVLSAEFPSKAAAPGPVVAIDGDGARAIEDQLARSRSPALVVAPLR